MACSCCSIGIRECCELINDDDDDICFRPVFFSFSALFIVSYFPQLFLFVLLQFFLLFVCNESHLISLSFCRGKIEFVRHHKCERRSDRSFLAGPSLSPLSLLSSFLVDTITVSTRHSNIMSTPRRRSVSTSFLFPVSPARASTISPDLNRINHLPLSGRLDKGFGVTFKSPARASPPTILSRTWSSLKTKDVFERLAAPTLSRRKTRKLFHHTIVTILIVYGCTLLVGFLFPKSFLAELRPSPSMLPNLARPPSHEIVQYPTRALLLVEELETVVLPVKEVKEREKEMVARKATMERFRREILWKEASAPPLQVTVVREKREYSHEATVIFLHVRAPPFYFSFFYIGFLLLLGSSSAIMADVVELSRA